MGWWPFSKKRDSGDIAQARLLERVEAEITTIRNAIGGYISDYYVHKAWNMKEIRRAISEKERAIDFIRSSNTPAEITNTSYRQQNIELINDINGIFSILRMPLKDSDIVAIEDAKFMKQKCQEVIDKIKGILRAI